MWCDEIEYSNVFKIISQNYLYVHMIIFTHLYESAILLCSVFSRENKSIVFILLPEVEYKKAKYMFLYNVHILETLLRIYKIGINDIVSQ